MFPYDSLDLYPTETDNFFDKSYDKNCTNDKKFLNPDWDETKPKKDCDKIL